MPSAVEINRTFRQRLKAREPLFGAFVKIGTSHAIEIMGDVGFDFVVIDREHAPLDVAAIDHLILAAQAAGIAALVRVQDQSQAAVQTVLDSGAAGILAPHVAGAAEAEAVAKACRYTGGTRGFSNTTRAGQYGGQSLKQMVDAQDASVTCIAMIEDVGGVENIDAILAVDGIDGVFIGKADLTVALGETAISSPATTAAVEAIAAAARRVGRTILGTAADRPDADRMRELGASALILGADVTYMRRAAADALRACNRSGANP